MTAALQSESTSEFEEVEDCQRNPDLPPPGAVLLLQGAQTTAVSLLSGTSVPGRALIGSAGLIGPPPEAITVAKGMG